MKYFLLLILLYTSFSLPAQQVHYTVSFPNAIHHEAHIELTVTGLPARPAVFKMSRSSPGRYATHEFGKNVYDVAARDLQGKALAVERVDGDVYQVAQHAGKITISYTLFADFADGTYAAIDPESIHLNMPACFLWIQGMDQQPISIRFSIPKENKGMVATQLVPTKDPYTFTAPGLQYFMDSPTKIGDLLFRSWKVFSPNGKENTIRIALESNAGSSQATELEEKTKKIVAEAKAVFGEFPAYEQGAYTFIISANPYVKGDGMEHRNSTMITVPLPVFNAYALQGVISHEYFHNWNVERIRPKTLEPFQFGKSNMSHELWFAEGFTQYYGEMLLARAGLIDARIYLSTLASLVNTKQNTPGGKYYSPIHSSNHAVFVDAGVSIDKNNYNNMYESYYPYGAAIALALDLELQTRYQKNIDAYMQAMWQRFGKREIPYTIPLMQQTLASITDAGFAADFFEKYIRGYAAINYSGLLASAGYDLKKANEGKASLGMNTRVTDQGKLMISNMTLKGSAAYEAGLDMNDEILKLDETLVKSQTDLTNFIKDKKPGDVVGVTYRHRGIEKQTVILLKEPPYPVLVPYEQSGKIVTTEMKKIRDSWFTSQVK